MTHSGQSLDQKRAAHALSKIKEMEERGAKFYVSYVSALPAIIVANGLGQALAMLLAKSKGNQGSEHYQLYAHVASWLSVQVKELKGDGVDDVITKLMSGNQGVYVKAQGEAMSYLNWLKQFARAYLRESEG
jgi:CRISPR-associated protein Cmr5